MPHVIIVPPGKDMSIDKLAAETRERDALRHPAAEDEPGTVAVVDRRIPIRHVVKISGGPLGVSRARSPDQGEHSKSGKGTEFGRSRHCKSSYRDRVAVDGGML